MAAPVAARAGARAVVVPPTAAIEVAVVATLSIGAAAFQGTMGVGIVLRALAANTKIRMGILDGAPLNPNVPLARTTRLSIPRLNAPANCVQQGPSNKKENTSTENARLAFLASTLTALGA